MSDKPWIEWSEADLLAELGRQLLGPGLGFGPEDPGRFRRFASSWIEDRLGDIRAAICADEAVKAVFERDMQERLSDFGVVADALAAMHQHPPVTLLAVVLLRRGYEVVCGCYYCGRLIVPVNRLDLRWQLRLSAIKPRNY
jgi:hypothetical protein